MRITGRPPGSPRSGGGNKTTSSSEAKRDDDDVAPPVLEEHQAAEVATVAELPAVEASAAAEEPTVEAAAERPPAPSRRSPWPRSTPSWAPPPRPRSGTMPPRSIEKSMGTGPGSPSRCAW